MKAKPAEFFNKYDQLCIGNTIYFASYLQRFVNQL